MKIGNGHYQQGGTIKRPIAKLCKMPIETNSMVDQQTPEKKRSRTAPTKLSLASIVKLIFLLLCCASSALSYQITPVNHGGVFFAHDKTAVIQVGSWHVTTKTNFNTTNILDTIEDGYKEIDLLCQRMQNLHPNMECTEKIRFFQWEVNELKNTIVNLPKRRIKRSRGLFGFLKDLIFGSDEAAEIEDLKSRQRTQESEISELIETTSNQLNITETQIKGNIDVMTKRLNLAISAVDQMEHWYSTINTMALEIHFLNVYESALSIVNTAHDQLTKIMTKKDYNNPAVIERINKFNALSQEQRVFLDAFQSLELISLDTYCIEELVVTELAIPVIYTRQFETFQISNLPNITTGTILDSPTERIAINYEEMLYAYITADVRIAAVNSSHILISFPILHRAPDNLDCWAATIFDRITAMESLCQPQPFDRTQELWIKLPNPNTYLFYHPQPANIKFICGGDRHEIKYTMGRIQMDDNCRVETDLNIILAEVQGNASSNRLFFKPLDHLSMLPDYQLEVTLQPIASIVNNYRLPSQGPKSKEVKGNQSEAWTQNVIWMFAVVIIVLVIGWSGLMIKKWRSRQPTTPEVFELQDLQRS